MSLFSSTVRVPNSGDTKANIYVVGEAPGADEVDVREPFVGVSGQKLRETLQRAGKGVHGVYFANLCQFRPLNNKFEIILRTKELQAGITELAEVIAKNRPNVIAALGNWPMYYLTGKTGKKLGTGIGRYRGSIFPCTLPGCEGIKVIPTYHPAFIARNPLAYSAFDQDIRRVVSDSEFPELNYPEMEMIIDPRGSALEEAVQLILNAPSVACDIESVKRSFHILCHGFGYAPGKAIVIPHSETDFARQDALRAIYESNVPKIFHNGGAFDIPMLAENNLIVNNYAWDTMAAQYVMWTQLPKSLDYLASIYTRQPYYKSAGRAEIPEDNKGWSEKFDKRALYEYNATDVVVTHEVYLAQQKEMLEGPPEWRKTFDFTMSIMPAAQRISAAGLLIDEPRRQQMKKGLMLKWGIDQFLLNQLTGFKTNVNSTKALPRIMYDKDKLGLPERKSGGKVTTDEDAIVSLISFCQDRLSKIQREGAAYTAWKVRLEVLNVILVIRGVRKLLSSYINIPISVDSRLRASYKVLGTYTGRWACNKWFDSTGANSQTFPREVLELQNYADIPELAAIMPYINELMEEDIGASSEDTGSEQDEDAST